MWAGLDNEVIYPEYKKHQLSPSPFVTILPLEVIHKVTPAINNIVVSVTLRHHIYRTSLTSGCRGEGIVELLAKSHYHRGLAINALNDEIRGYHRARLGVLIGGIIVFIFSEVRFALSGCYICILPSLIQRMMAHYRVTLLLREVETHDGDKMQLQESPTPAWKHHVEALARVITQAGGMRKICRAHPMLKATMILFIM